MVLSLWDTGLALLWTELKQLGRLSACCYLRTHTGHSLLSFRAKPRLLPLPRNYKPSCRDTHATCRRKFWLPSSKLSGWSPRSHREDNHFSRLPPPIFNFKRKKQKQKTAAFPDLRTRLFGGFGKLIFDSCPVSSCTDVGPIKETPESHFLLHISTCFSCKFFPTKYQARKLWVLKMSWFYGSILPSLSYIWYLRYKRPRF